MSLPLSDFAARIEEEQAKETGTKARVRIARHDDSDGTTVGKRGARIEWTPGQTYTPEELSVFPEQGVIVARTITNEGNEQLAVFTLDAVRYIEFEASNE